MPLIQVRNTNDSGTTTIQSDLIEKMEWVGRAWPPYTAITISGKVMTSAESPEEIQSKIRAATAQPPTAQSKADTLARYAAAFELWEDEFRADPSTFLTAEEIAAMETAPLAVQRAMTFVGYLRAGGQEG